MILCEVSYEVKCCSVWPRSWLCGYDQLPVVVVDDRRNSVSTCCVFLHSHLLYSTAVYCPVLVLWSFFDIITVPKELGLSYFYNPLLQRCQPRAYAFIHYDTEFPILSSYECIIYVYIFLSLKKKKMTLLEYA